MRKVNGPGDGLNVTRSFPFGPHGFYIRFNLAAIPQGKLAFRFPHVIDLRFQQRPHGTIRVVCILWRLRYWNESHIENSFPAALWRALKIPGSGKNRPEAGRL